MNQTGRGHRLKFLHAHEFYLCIFVCVVLAVFQLINRNFLTGENMLDVLKDISFMGLLTTAMFVVIIAGGIDISICPIAACVQYLMGILMVKFDAPPVVALILPIVLGIAMGSLNGVLIHFLKVPPMIVTIATMNIYNSILQIVTGGNWLYQFPQWFADFSNWKLVSFSNNAGGSYGLSGLVLIWIVAMLFVYLLMNKCTLGRKIYAMGSNIVAAERAGINILGMRVFVYALCGMLSAIAGIVQAASAQFITTNSMSGLDMYAIAAIALGGARLAGGRGTIFGTILGTCVLQIVGNGLQLSKVSSYWVTASVGIILMVSIIITAVQGMLEDRRER